jgi:hypothetical protein
MKSDTNFLEIIGAITVGILVIVFMVWIGWIFLLLIFWGIFCFWVFWGVDELLVNKKISGLLGIVMGCIFSTILFWLGVSSIYEPLTHHLEDIIIWHCVILILIAILAIKLRKQS